MEVAIDRVWAIMTLIAFVFSILIPGFIWINNNFNEYPEEFDDLDGRALIRLEIKKLQLQELKQWIDENNLTQKQIGEQLKVNQKTIANILYKG